ncbi:hypothetical protein ACFFHM_02850 [Halalkalibacter kiskunsagensis]|uniref:Uncharacterized protein n=1 Tax=Halalkalibacter kiskunsagensis TaxID=1548599 RepID=A0ABV6K8X7_9BACI
MNSQRADPLPVFPLRIDHLKQVAFSLFEAVLAISEPLLSFKFTRSALLLVNAQRADPLPVFPLRIDHLKQVAFSLFEAVLAISGAAAFF